MGYYLPAKPADAITVKETNAVMTALNKDFPDKFVSFNGWDGYSAFFLVGRSMDKDLFIEKAKKHVSKLGFNCYLTEVRNYLLFKMVCFSITPNYSRLSGEPVRTYLEDSLEGIEIKSEYRYQNDRTNTTEVR